MSTIIKELFGNVTLSINKYINKKQLCQQSCFFIKDKLYLFNNHLFGVFLVIKFYGIEVYPSL